jgi:hypothetical protein
MALLGGGLAAYIKGGRYEYKYIFTVGGGRTTELYII